MKSLFDVFISYGRADSKAFAAQVNNKLIEFGLNVWFDQNDIPPAVDWQNQIKDGIEKAHNFIFIIAPHAVKSSYCNQEIELAVQYNKRIIPLLYLNSDAFLEKMHPAIKKINWLFFQEGINDFNIAFNDLIKSINHHNNYVEQHTKLLLKALEWSRNQKQTKYLLINQARTQAESWLKIKFKNEQPPCKPTDLHCEYICESIKHAHNQMASVFISYAAQNLAIKNSIVRILMNQTLTVYNSEQDIRTGTKFQSEIKQGIEGSDNFIYLLSADTLQSQLCPQELAYALANNKRIICLVLDPNNQELLTPQLRGLELINYRPQQDSENDFIWADKLLNVLHRQEQYYRQHKILLVKTLKWQRQNRNPSLLLRGYELQNYQAWLTVALTRSQHLPLSCQVEFIEQSSQQPADLSLDVFIANAPEDDDFARKLNQALQDLGKITWFDRENFVWDTNIQQEIYRGIESSDNFLFIASPSSVNSPDCLRGIEYAEKLNKRFINVIYREVQDNKLHPALARIHSIDFNKHEGDFYANFSEVIRTLDTDREYVHSHSKWSHRAREWDLQGRNQDLLLRGNELALAQNWLNLAQQENKQPPATDLQQAFINSSQKAIQAAEQAEKRRQQEILRLQQERAQEAEESARRLRYLLATVVVGFVVSIILGRQAKLNEIQAISKYSEVLFVSHRRLDALKEAIKARRELQYFLGGGNFTQNLVEKALRQAVYGVREYNSFSGHSDRIYGLDFSLDGQLIASASGDKTVKIWQLDGTLLHTLRGHTERVWKVAFSPNSELIASTSVDQTVKLWKRDGSLWQTLTGHKAEVWGIAFSPDGQLIASGSDDQTVKLWKRNEENGFYEYQKTLAGHSSTIYSIAFSPDGQMIASASADKTIKLWKNDGVLLQTLTGEQGHRDRVRGIAFSPDGQTIASSSDDNMVKLWKWNQVEKSYQYEKTLKGHSARVYSVAFSSDGEIIASGSFDKTIKLWQADGTLITSLKGHRNEVTGIVFRPPGQKPELVSGQQEELMIASGSWDKTVKLWKPISQFFQPLRGHRGRVYSVAFSSESKLLASGGNDRMVKLWQSDGTLLANLQGHSARIYVVAFSPNNELIASGSNDRTVRLWKRDDKDGVYKHHATLKGHQDGVLGVSFCCNGELVVTGSNDSTIKLWQLDGTLVTTFNGHRDEVSEVAFNQDFELIASASDDHTVKLWKLDGTLLQTLRGHSAAVIGLSISPNGKLIASASRDNTVKLWRWDDKKGAYQDYKTLRGHSGAVDDVDISPDGQLIASASSDSTVKLWNTEGKLLFTLSGHIAGVRGVNFSPDGQRIASASYDNTVILWDLNNIPNLDQLLIEGCRWSRNYLEHNVEIEKSDRSLCKTVRLSE